MSQNITAQIIASYGRRYLVEIINNLENNSGNQILEATTRSKRTDFVCGDYVDINIINQEQAVIEKCQERQSLLYRQDAWKSKLIAANVTQLIIVLAAQPSPSEILLQRALIAAESANIKPLILFNKADLELPNNQHHIWQEKLDFYHNQLGYSVLKISALSPTDIEKLREILDGHTNIFLGQSGMGKSTLTNALLGEEIARTNDISTALDSGKHTTTHAQLYHLKPLSLQSKQSNKLNNKLTKLIDSPGLQEFGLFHLQIPDLLNYFPDMRHLIGQCRFHNCTHRAEPNCAVKSAVEKGEVQAQRLELLQKIINELEK